MVQRAKDYIDARECHLRERERQVCARESVTERLGTRLELKELRLNEEMARCEEKIKVNSSCYWSCLKCLVTLLLLVCSAVMMVAMIQAILASGAFV